MARPYPTGHFRLYKSSSSRTGKSLPVQIVYAVKSVAVRRAVGISVMERDWNQNENKGCGGIRASYGPDYRSVNNRLLKKIIDTDTKISDWCEKHPGELTVDMLRALLDDSPIAREDNGIDFIEFVKNVLKEDLDRNRIGQSVYKNGLSAMHIFSQFLKATGNGTYACDKIYVSEISENLVGMYISWRRDFKANSDETINHALTPILKGCAKAAIAGYIPNTLSASIQQMRLAKTQSLQNDSYFKVKHLSKGELADLIKFYRDDKAVRRKEYVEMFLFAMYACGLRFVDILTLQWSDIDFERNTINKIQVKTRNRNVIPLTGPAKKILERWRGRYNRFVFGLLEDTFNLDDADALYHIRNSKTKGINQSLSIVGKKLNLKFDLTFHVARHTFAVQSLNSGMQLTMVSQLLGHSSSEITEKVYAHFVPAKLMDELMKMDLPDLV